MHINACYVLDLQKKNYPKVFKNKLISTEEGPKMQEEITV